MGETFNYGYIEDLSLYVDNDTMPTVYCTPPTSTTFDTFMGQREMGTIILFFVNKFDIEEDEEDKEAIIEGCKKRAWKWLREVKDGNAFEIIGKPNLLRIDFELNIWCVGVGVQITLKEYAQGYCSLT